MSRWIEIAPGVQRLWREPKAPPARSALPCPNVISDEMPPVEQVDGQFYSSKSKFRAVGRAHGLTEVGNEKPKLQTRATASPRTQQQRRDAIKAAVQKYRAGVRPKGDR